MSRNTNWNVFSNVKFTINNFWCKSQLNWIFAEFYRLFSTEQRKQIGNFDFFSLSVCVRASKKEKHWKLLQPKKDLSQMIFTPYCSYFTYRKHDDLYQSNYACAVKTNTW